MKGGGTKSGLGGTWVTCEKGNGGGIKAVFQKKEGWDKEMAGMGLHSGTWVEKRTNRLQKRDGWGMDKKIQKSFSRGNKKEPVDPGVWGSEEWGRDEEGG